MKELTLDKYWYTVGEVLSLKLHSINSEMTIKLTNDNVIRFFLCESVYETCMELQKGDKVAIRFESKSPYCNEIKGIKKFHY